MTPSESQACFALCHLLLLNGAPASSMQDLCMARLGLAPGKTTIGGWREKVGVPYRNAAHLTNNKGRGFGGKKPFDPFTPEETALIREHNRLAAFMRPTKHNTRKAA